MVPERATASVMASNEVSSQNVHSAAWPRIRLLMQRLDTPLVAENSAARTSCISHTFSCMSRNDTDAGPSSCQTFLARLIARWQHFPAGEFNLSLSILRRKQIPHDDWRFG